MSPISSPVQGPRDAAAPKQRLARAVLGAVLVGVFATGLGATPVHADKLDDQKHRIDKQVEGTQEDLESLNAQVEKTAAKLRSYQDRLPAAQRELSDAQAKVTKAQRELAALQQRLSKAKSDQAALKKKRDENAEAQERNEHTAGQIASQAYRQGGMENKSGISMLFSGQDPTSMASNMEMADRAMQSRNQSLEELRSADAQDRNNEARLKAISKEIKDLTQQADAALKAQQEARGQAQAAKDKLDRLVKDTSSTQKKLKGQVSDAKSDLKKQKSEQKSINEQIRKRQERLKREAEERARKARLEAKRKEQAAEAARKKRAADAAKLQRQATTARAKATKQTTNATPSGKVAKSSWGLIVPSTGGHISSPYGWRPTPAGTIDYFGTGGYVHAGQDWGYGGACGAPIKAAASGTVKEAGWKSTHGQVVSIDHAIMKGHALTTNYHHMSKVGVSVGQHVSQGQTVGYVGTTGNSTGCHLHFETIVDGSLTNPINLLP